ncbi:MAG: glucose 1-dehydrogenase [bacterium]|nr:glucose 1-dehydrogenase [bacterium]
MANLKDKVAIITGARRGMGRADALTLAKAGARVVVSDISREDCEKVVKEVEKEGGQAIAVQCDISKKFEVDNLVKAAVDKWGKVDILVNNAGICQFKSFLEMTEEEWDKTLDINLKGYFLCAQAAAKEMAKQKSGVIVNIASIAMGQQGVGMPGIVHYCASKGGIVAMTEALAVELAPFNIRVNAIAPGAIDTPMVQETGMDQKAIEGMLTRVPLRRMGKAEEISTAVLFLASDDSSYMTGATVVVDGGWLAG